jgi:hypothetical protein
VTGRECRIEGRCATRSSSGSRLADSLVRVTEALRWRIGVAVRSPDIGAAAAFADAVDYDDVQPFPVPGMVLVLGSWVWQEGRETAWWIGAIVEAQSAADAAQRVTSVVAARTGGVRALAMTLDVTASTARSTGELVAEEEVALHSIPGSAAPFIVPIRARAYARSGGRLTVEWSTSGDYEVAHVTVEVTDFLTIGLFEHRWPLTGPNAIGDPMLRRSRHVVLDVGDAPPGLPVLDRYSGERVPEGKDHPETTPIRPYIYTPNDFEPPPV